MTWNKPGSAIVSVLRCLICLPGKAFPQEFNYLTERSADSDIPQR